MFFYIFIILLFEFGVVSMWDFFIKILPMNLLNNTIPKIIRHTPKKRFSSDIIFVRLWFFIICARKKNTTRPIFVKFGLRVVSVFILFFVASTQNFRVVSVFIFFFVASTQNFRGGFFFNFLFVASTQNFRVVSVFIFFFVASTQNFSGGFFF